MVGHNFHNLSIPQQCNFVASIRKHSVGCCPHFRGLLPTPKKKFSKKLISLKIKIPYLIKWLEVSAEKVIIIDSLDVNFGRNVAQFIGHYRISL